MREIKFRTWDAEDKEMNYLNNMFLRGNQVGWSNEHYVDLSEYQENTVLMQYTGLKDNTKWEDLTTKEQSDWLEIGFNNKEDWNGKEIYEGDIVKYKIITGFSAEDSFEKDFELTSDMFSEEIDTIEFENGEFIPRADHEFPDDGYYGWRKFDFEVIGNIYQNPELLT